VGPNEPDSTSPVIHWTPELLPQIVARQIGGRALSAPSRTCPVRAIWGGGMYSHRYREGTVNPLVYCLDLLALISHIRDRVRNAGP
jgi:uncharacterized protein